MITTYLFATFLFAFQDTPPEPARDWRTPSAIAEEISSLVATHASVSVTTIGFSKNGNPIQCIQVAREGATPIDMRSAVLLVAGIDGEHLLGTEVATDLVQTLLAMEHKETASLLETHKLYIIPQVNPDAANFYFNEVQHEQRRNLTPNDNDHDGIKDEDGGEDLNGDGFVTMMRVPDLEKATHLADKDNPRLNITPKPFEDQVASFVLYTEGIDNDGDGKYNEDGVGGVDLNKNFMHGYTEHSDGSGVWQLSESESKALADFVLQHQEIATILVYGQHDTLSKPLSENGKDKAGAPKKLSEGDVELYKRISEKFVEITELLTYEQVNWDGSFVAWAYAQYGVPSFSTSLWTRPKEEKKSEDKDTEDKDTEDKDTESKPIDSDAEETSENEELTPSGVGDISQETMDELYDAAIEAGYIDGDEARSEVTPSLEEAEMYCKMMGIEIRRITTNDGKKKSSSEEGKWLEYSDSQRDGKGFVPWEPFDHPQLGQVEIGGWVPYFKTLPPTDIIESITQRQSTFLIDLASRLPNVRLSSPCIKQLGSGLWEVTVAVINDGWFPTGTEMAKKNKRARPFVVRLDVPNETIISGRKVNLIWSLNGEGTRKWYKWILQGESNSDVNITLFSEKFGTITITTPLKETKGGDA
jgi:hypothetical protein